MATDESKNEQVNKPGVDIRLFVTPIRWRLPPKVGIRQVYLNFLCSLLAELPGSQEGVDLA